MWYPVKRVDVEHAIDSGRFHDFQLFLYFEKDPRRINALEELEILKATASDRILNIVHNINPPLPDTTFSSGPDSGLHGQQLTMPLGW